MEPVFLDNRKAIIDYSNGDTIFQAWYLSDFIPGHVGDAIIVYGHVDGSYPSTSLYVQSLKSFIEETDWTEEVLDAIQHDGIKKRVQEFIAGLEE